MSDDRKAFTFFRSYYEAASQLPKTQRLAYYDAVVKYALDGEQPALTGVAKAMFILSKPNLDMSISKAQAGAKGGKSRGVTDCDEMESDGKQTPSRHQADTKQNESTSEANAKQTPSDKDKDKDIGDRIQDKDEDTDTPPLPPESGGSDPDPFDRFWEVYPRKEGKGAARKAWQKIKPGKALTEKILQAVEFAKTSREWTRDGGQYIPHPSTWLNQERWEDKLTPGGGDASGNLGTNTGEPYSFRPTESRGFKTTDNETD